MSSRLQCALVAFLFLSGCGDSAPTSVHVSFVGATINYPSYMDQFGDMRAYSSEECLYVYLDISNVTKNKKVTYQGWGTTIGATLRDEHGNNYKLLNFGKNSRCQYFLKGKGPFLQTLEKMIEPGYAIWDMLVFEKPIANCKRLTLRLPGRNIGESGSFVLEFDNKEFSRQIPADN